MKETKKVNKVHRGFVLALALLLISVAALASSGGIQVFLQRMKGDAGVVLPGGDELFQGSVGGYSDDYVTYRIVDQVFDGHSAGLMVEIEAKAQDTLVLSKDCTLTTQCDRLGHPCMPDLGTEGTDERSSDETYALIAKYAQ